jgi:hypothetical protein
LEPISVDNEIVAVTNVQQSSLKTPGNTPFTMSGSSNSVSSKRVTASSSLNQPKKKGNQDVDGIISSLLGDEEDFHSLRVQEVTAREQEAKARMLEAEAISAKASKETALLVFTRLRALGNAWRVI